jgi:hypothetical protein
MSSESPAGPPTELSIWLDAAETVHSVAKTITVPTAAGQPPRTLTINVPAGVKAATLLRIPGMGRINPLTGEPNDLFVRVRVRRAKRPARRMLLGVGSLLVFAFIVWLSIPHPGSSTAAAASSSDAPFTAADLPTFIPDSVEPSVAPAPPVPEVTLEPTEVPTSQVYESGTCLSGQLPNSTVAVPVSSDVSEVSCSSSRAHYRVIQTIPGTTELELCDKNPRTQYAFSSEEEMNGITTIKYVYCLIGIGSYSR